MKILNEFKEELENILLFDSNVNNEETSKVKYRKFFHQYFKDKFKLNYGGEKIPLNDIPLSFEYIEEHIIVKGRILVKEVSM